MRRADDADRSAQTRVQNLTVDFNGDGSPDLTTTDPTATLQMTYTLPGLYTAHLTVTTDAGNSFQATVPIAVQDEALVVGILKDLSTSLTGQLAAGNANGALASSPTSASHCPWRWRPFPRLR